jgi:DNA mismatch repair protein MutS
MYTIASQLRKIMDLERALRRMVLGTFSPMEWVHFDSSIEIVKELVPNIHMGAIVVLQHAYQMLNLEECSKYGLHEIKSNVFQKNIHMELDSCMETMKHHMTFLEELVAQIGTEICKLDCNERDGYYISITKRRWETFVKNRGLDDTLMMDIPIHEIQSKPISSTSSILRLSHPRIESASSGIIEQQRIIQVEATKKYKEFLGKFVDECQSDILYIADQVAQFDVVCTCARNAKEYGYCRPEVETGDGSSFAATGIRHPIIERIQQSVMYVKNDISMADNGVLLYGVNSSGKSSFMKAIGLNIIMAQAGMYVAASTLRYVPYHHIFTRITGSDNIYRGMSSFVVEMTELRNILQRADKHSLVLGDELCAGTEAISAISIVAAGVKHLIEKKASFLFATHLHELTDVLPQNIINSNVLQVAHMHIAIEGNKIIYDRKLQPGKGSPLYGLEVCNALALPEGFLKDAHVVRKKLMNVASSIVDVKLSRYNSQVLMHKCRLCGETASETHHIRHQATADHGFVENGVDVHHAANLIPLCEKCHLEEHHGKSTKIVGYQQTSHGIEIVREKIDVVQKQFSGFEDVRRVMCFMPSLGW